MGRTALAEHSPCAMVLIKWGSTDVASNQSHFWGQYSEGQYTYTDRPPKSVIYWSSLVINGNYTATLLLIIIVIISTHMKWGWFISQILLVDASDRQTDSQTETERNRERNRKRNRERQKQRQKKREVDRGEWYMYTVTRRSWHTDWNRQGYTKGREKRKNEKHRHKGRYIETDTQTYTQRQIHKHKAIARQRAS